MFRVVTLGLGGFAGLGVLSVWNPFTPADGPHGGSNGTAGGVVVLDLEGDDLAGLVPEAKRMEAYEKGAGEYDTTVGWEEVGMGLPLLRWWLVSRYAHGSVLEVAAGTGRNTKYLPSPPKVTSLLLADASRAMLEVAEAKVGQQGELAGKTGFYHGSLEALVAEEGVGTFDTVIDTFGLCSYEDPVAALNHMGSLLADSPDSVLLLLEHGKSHYNWLNEYLDAKAVHHAGQWGCWFNRDIGAIVDSASDLELVSISRFHFGTTWMLVLRRKRKNLRIE